MFRTTAIVAPDRFLIVSTKLSSCGFAASIILAQKICALYSLCEEQLSHQVNLPFSVLFFTIRKGIYLIT